MAMPDPAGHVDATLHGIDAPAISSSQPSPDGLPCGPMDGGEGSVVEVDGASEGPERRRRRPEATPAQRALALLVRREHARGELRAKLVARGITAEAAAEAVDKMTAEGWQDDGRFAVSLARMRASGGYGPGRIRAELAGHGVADVEVEAALQALAEAGDADWPRRARELVLRRYGEEIDSNLSLERRASAFLARRGFDGDCAQAARGRKRR